MNADEDEVMSAPLVTVDSDKKRRECCSIGAFVNYSIAVVFLATFLACVIVIGTIGTLQSHLSGYSDPRRSGSSNPNATNITRHACYLFSECSGDPVDIGYGKCYFKPDENSECEGTMVGYALIALVALAFIISTITKAIINQKLVGV